MQLHASCAARDGAGVLLIGPSGSGKSDLVLRLLDYGFQLVADDRVDLADQVARPPAALAGLLEVRGLGIVRLPYTNAVKVELVVELGLSDRLPEPARRHGLPMIRVDPARHAAPAVIAMALQCATGRRTLDAGALA